MNDHQKMVEEFMQSFGQEVPDKPTLALDAPSPFPFALRAKLILEEAIEFAEASGLIPHIETNYAGKGVPHTESVGTEPDMVEMIDAMCDILYVTYGAASAMGIDLTPYFAEVHRTNMAKLGPDGKPILRADGKGMKPPGWKPPDLAAILAKELAK